VAARVVAVLADALQIGLLPLFVGGGLSMANDVLDVVVAVTLVALVGWHWAFLPAFLSELVPVFDLVPTWSAAVFLATRQAAVEASASPEASPAGQVPRALPPKGDSGDGG
jgi:hypothetical protein